MNSFAGAPRHRYPVGMTQQRRRTRIVSVLCAICTGVCLWLYWDGNISLNALELWARDRFIIRPFVELRPNPQLVFLGIDLMAGAYLEARITGAGGAVTVRRDMNVPGLFLLLGQSTFSGYMRPYFPVGITLKTGGSTAATGHAVGDASGEFFSKFVDADGDQYRLAGGESLKAPKLGIAWQVPQIHGTVNRQTDVVSGTCFPNAVWAVVAGDFGFANGTTGGSGNFSVDMSDQWNLVKGDFVAIGCFTNAGDLVEQDLTVQ
jgi:hypothetical protein